MGHYGHEMIVVDLVQEIECWLVKFPSLSSPLEMKSLPLEKMRLPLIVRELPLETKESEKMRQRLVLREVKEWEVVLML